VNRDRLPWILLALVMVAGGVGWYAGHDDSLPSEKHPEETIFEVAELADKTNIQAAFALARSPIDAEESAQSVLAQFEGRQTFLCAYSLAKPVHCGAGSADNLAESIRGAAKELATKNVDLDEARLKLDFVVWSQPTELSLKESDNWSVAGTIGYFAQRDDQYAFVTPAEVIGLGIYDENEGMGRGVSKKMLAQTLRDRNEALFEPQPAFSLTRFRATSWVEVTDGGGDVVRLYRTHKFEWDSLEADHLLQRSVLAADYLLAATAPNGKIRYHYDPRDDQSESSYNLIRHAGTIYSVLMAYQRTGFEPYRKSAEASIEYLFKKSRRDERQGPWGGGDSMYVVEGSSIKLGGAGLGLLALVQHMESTGDREKYLDEARAYARFLVSQQKEDGEFHSYAPQELGGTAKDRVSIYYPGEAILGLARMYVVDPDPLWRDTAVRGANWLIKVRDAGKSHQQLANDHWLMIALSYLYEETRDPLYLSHSLAIARAVQYQQEKNRFRYKAHRDYRGGYYNPPRSTPAATRAEGLVAVLDTCAIAGEECAYVREVLAETVIHMNLSQYTPELVWWMPNRAVTLGAFNGGIYDVEVRNDYVQHAMSALLGMERHLAQSQERELPGGPSWSRKIAQSEGFPGLEQQEIKGLRRWTEEIRPTTAWEVDDGANQAPETAP
jgi:hypothetical protein